MRLAVIAFLGACALLPDESGATGMSCSVDVPYGQGASYDACIGVWPEGPHQTTAYFFLTHPLLGDGNSPPVYWSDYRCPNLGTYACALPINAYSPITVEASFSHFGTNYSFDAEAHYELGW